MTVGSTLTLSDADHYFGLEKKVYPTLAAGATVVSSTANWTYGAYAVIVPANTITNAFRVDALSISSCNRDAVFQLELYQGAGDDIITAIRFAVEGGFFGNQVYIIGSEIVAANSQIRARVASSNGAGAVATLRVSIVYYAH